jgi:small conductance mechanosensitive channel
LGIGVFSALAVLGLDDSVASLLAGLGLVGLALGFALQDIMANFASGVILTFKSPFQLGDFVETSGHMGTITEVQLRSTRIVTLEGRTVNIPNKLIFQNPFINYTAQGKVRIELLFPIHVKSDSQRAIDLLIPVIEKVSDRLPNEKVVGGINRITDFFIEIQIFLWVPTGLKPLLLFRSEAYLGGLKELRKNGIDIAQTSFVSAN